MIGYVVKRVLGAIPLVLGIATVLFIVVNLAPGDPVSRLVGPNVSPEAMAQMRSNWGLDEPLPVRYVKWLGELAQGEFGESFSRRRPARDVVFEILPNTLVLSAFAIVGAFLIGILLGVLQAVRRGSALDSILSIVSLFFYSMPAFWLAIMMVLLFSLQAQLWGWPISFPGSGMISVDHSLMTFTERLGDRVSHLVLPAVSLSLILAAGIARYTRGTMIEVLGEDYIRTARAKGLSERTVIFRHALRNALLPLLTLAGLYLPFLLSGTVFIETVFAWPGMGKLMVDSIATRDYPVVMAGGFLFAVVVVAGNLLADILYAVVDPRVRYE